MVLSVQIRRRAIAAVLGGGVVAGAVLFAGAPLALADPPPGCSAADRQQVMSGVSSATAGYLFAHPDVNAFFSSLAGQPRDAIRSQIRDYLNANPGVQSDLRGIRQPMTDMRDRCGSYFAMPAAAPSPPM